MAAGMMFAFLATMLGKKGAARWGTRRVTIAAVGTDASGRWVMGTLSDGSVVKGASEDFSIPEKRPRRKKSVDTEPEAL